MKITAARQMPTVAASELKALYPAETQSDIARYLALAKHKGISRENTLWLISFSGCVASATARLEAADLPRQRPH